MCMWSSYMLQQYQNLSKVDWKHHCVSKRMRQACVHHKVSWHGMCLTKTMRTYRFDMGIWFSAPLCEHHKLWSLTSEQLCQLKSVWIIVKHNLFFKTLTAADVLNVHLTDGFWPCACTCNWSGCRCCTGRCCPVRRGGGGGWGGLCGCKQNELLQNNLTYVVSTLTIKNLITLEPLNRHENPMNIGSTEQMR